MDTHPLDLKQVRLLVHIPFHFVEVRLPYLQQVLEAFCTYKLGSVTVVIDSNDKATISAVSNMNLDTDISVSVQVHHDLENPFLLTWCHRSAFTACQDKFDLFLYLEDDILIPWSTFKEWASDIFLLNQHGWLRGVLRVEPNAQGELMATDWSRPMQNPLVYEIESRSYIRPEKPYQACWCYTREQIKQFMTAPVWKTGANPRSYVHTMNKVFSKDKLIRERAALGLTFAAPGWHRVLIPISNNSISKNVFVYHLPANYADNPIYPFCNHPISKLLVGRLVPANSLQGKAREILHHFGMLLMRGTGRHPTRRLMKRLRALRDRLRGFFPTH